ncbi:hypothetical protein EPH95_16030 [Salicibibacter halophilus]|uniref:Uncharacterized protein n=1 Tax=Salicibibacter halophilus TaxID=2502791 RepID=A0A514LML3_9BACI|nr:hypothetical protein EPH95_16030 [Salicibibacter halophilus]
MLELTFDECFHLLVAVVEDIIKKVDELLESHSPIEFAHFITDVIKHTAKRPLAGVFLIMGGLGTVDNKK